MSELDDAPRHRYRCLTCGRFMLRYSDFEEFQHDECGGLVVNVEEAIRLMALRERERDQARSALAQVTRERDEARADSESWRAANHRWQVWGDRQRSIIGSILNGDEPTREAIENRLTSWAARDNHAGMRADKLRALCREACEIADDLSVLASHAVHVPGEATAMDVRISTDSQRLATIRAELEKL